MLLKASQGAAVKAGVLCARGELILMADADGATVAADQQLLEESLLALKPSSAQLAWSSGTASPLAGSASASGRLGLAVGSRAHMQQQVRCLVLSFRGHFPKRSMSSKSTCLKAEISMI